jgi:hypothetical protein
VASDIDKEEEAIKAGIHRSELIYAAAPVNEDTELPNDIGVLELKHPSKKIQTESVKYCKEGKIAVDDNYLRAVNLNNGCSTDTGNAASRRLLGKSLEDITSPAKKTIKSTSYCQLPSSAMAVTSSPRAIQHSTIARLNERPALGMADLGFGSPLRNKENNNYEVAC